MDKQKAMERLDAIEAEAKALRALVEAPEPASEPSWKKNPEELEGKLCWVWDEEEDEKHVESIVELDKSDVCYPYRGGTNWWRHASPLTPDELALMTWRPKTRYDWSKAPEWAMWMATDPDGSTYAFAYEPHICNMYHDEWMRTDFMDHDRSQRITGATGKPYPDWRDSLEHRPEGI